MLSRMCSSKRTFISARAPCVSVALGTLLVAGLLTVSGLAQGRRGGAVPVPSISLEWVEPVPLDSDTADRLFTAYDTGRYADFDRLARTLGSSIVNPFEFEAEAERWMHGAPDRPRRAFVAAAVALELASLTQVPFEEVLDRAAFGRRHMAIQMSFVLAELGCAWLRDHPPPAAEQAWHAAFVALARAVGGEGHVIPVQDPRVRWIELGRMSLFGVAASVLRDGARGQQEREDLWRSVYPPLMRRLQGHAAAVSRSTRINSQQPFYEHSRHLLARFPDDPHPLFLEALVLEGWRRRVADTLLFEGLWLDAGEVERIAAGGGRAVRAIPRNRRMDPSSAERLIRVVPEPEESLSISVEGRGRPSAAFTSLMLWDIVDAFRAVPDQDPVAAETALRLGHTYVRLARPDLALPALARAESLGTTPYELYLARLVAGAVFTRTGHRAEAITAFRGALQAVPGAPSASFALAPLLLQVDAREEAGDVLEAAMRLPQVDDPLHAYYRGDPTTVSRALARLREEAVQ